MYSNHPECCWESIPTVNIPEVEEMVTLYKVPSPNSNGGMWLYDQPHSLYDGSSINNNKSSIPPVTNSVNIELTPQEIRIKKIELLRKLSEIKSKGFSLTKEYDFNLKAWSFPILSVLSVLSVMLSIV